MEIKEAMDILEKDIHTDVPKAAVSARKHDAAVRMALVALEKQIPVKPIILDELNGDIDYECPLCGKQVMPASDVVDNPYEIAYPIYKITGEGECTLVVNDGKMVANIGQNLTIDTGRKLAYREDGTLSNTSVTGDYDNLILIEGRNKIEITDGFELKVIPNWRRL